LERTKRFEDVPLNIYIPEPITILITVLSFLAGFLYRQYSDKEDIADAYDEGFEKGARSVVSAVAQITGKDIELDFDSDR
jgi:hypothetical protein